MALSGYDFSKRAKVGIWFLKFFGEREILNLLYPSFGISFSFYLNRKKLALSEIRNACGAWVLKTLKKIKFCVLLFELGMGWPVDLISFPKACFCVWDRDGKKWDWERKKQNVWLMTF